MSDATPLQTGDTLEQIPPSGEVKSQDLSASQPPLAAHTEESIKSQLATSVLTNEQCSGDLKVESHVLYPVGHCSLNGTTPPAIFEDISLDGMTSGKESSRKTQTSQEPPAAISEDISMDGMTSGKESSRKTQTSQEPPAAIFEDISMDGLGQGKHENHNEGTQISFSTVLGLNLAESKSSLAPELSSNGTQAVTQIQPQLRRRKRKRKRDDIMEHSGLESSLVKRVAIQVEAMSCLKPSGIDMDSTPEMVARELVKCMHEPKYELLKDVVRVLGVERTMELFEETVKIQESGGQLTADGNHKRTPGGVFLTLIKNTVSADQKKEIFKKDKEIRLHREKEEKRRKKAREHSERVKMDQRLLRERADRQLHVFRAQLSPSNLPAVIPGDRRERNMHKRVSAPDPESLKKVGVFDRLGHKPAGQLQGGEVQAMEVDTVSSNDSRRRRKDISGVKEENVLAEHRLAEEFEHMNDCDLDFGIELS